MLGEKNTTEIKVRLCLEKGRVLVAPSSTGHKDLRSILGTTEWDGGGGINGKGMEERRKGRKEI